MAALLLATLFCVSCANALEKGASSDRRISDAISEIKHSRDDLEHRRHVAGELGRFMLSQPSGVLNPTLIGEIAGLLDDPDDEVRYWVAGALGAYGPAAKGAAPKLLTALALIDCVNQDLNSGASIRFALEKIGEAQPPRNCVNATN